jgi:circadian clock protein KaiB
MSSVRPANAPRGVEPRGLRLRLYVAGRLPCSIEAEANLDRLCAEQDGDRPGVEIVDVLLEPERALSDGIIVTPTLVRVAPLPAVQILGALSNLRLVRAALGLVPRTNDDAR